MGHPRDLKRGDHSFGRDVGCLVDIGEGLDKLAPKVDIYIQFDTNWLSIFFGRLELVMLYCVDCIDFKLFSNYVVDLTLVFVEFDSISVNVARCSIRLNVAIDDDNTKQVCFSRHLGSFRFHRMNQNRR